MQAEIDKQEKNVDDKGSCYANALFGALFSGIIGALWGLFSSDWSLFGGLTMLLLVGAISTLIGFGFAFTISWLRVKATNAFVAKLALFLWAMFVCMLIAILFGTAIGFAIDGVDGALNLTFLMVFIGLAAAILVMWLG